MYAAMVPSFVVFVLFIFGSVFTRQQTNELMGELKEMQQARERLAADNTISASARYVVDELAQRVQVIAERALACEEARNIDRAQLSDTRESLVTAEKRILDLLQENTLLRAKSR
jgi:hypothetical protein